MKRNFKKVTEILLATFIFQIPIFSEIIMRGHHYY